MKKLLIALSTVTALLLSSQAFSFTLIEIVQIKIAEQTREAPVAVGITSEAHYYSVGYTNADGSTGSADCSSPGPIELGRVQCTLTDKR